jgi:hypothetical protein
LDGHRLLSLYRPPNISTAGFFLVKIPPPEAKKVKKSQHSNACGAGI